MNICTKCGSYFVSDKQTDHCPRCEHQNYNANGFSNCDIPMPNCFGEQKGWICPVCGRGVAPWTSYCPCQSDWKITYGTSTGGDYDIKECLDYMGNYNADLLEG